MDQKYKLDYEMLAKRIKAARKAANMTQEQLAEKLDMSLNFISKLEINLVGPSLQTLVNLANVLNVDVNYLLFGEERDPDPILEGMICGLPEKDKVFLIHIINGLKRYHEGGGEG